MNSESGDFTAGNIEMLMMATTEHGATLKEIHGISDMAMENIYAHAYQFYNEGRLDEAEKFFRFLCLYDLKNADYFIGLGAVQQLKKNYEKACEFYSLAYLIAEDNFNPLYYIGQCQLLMGNYVKALKSFNILAERCTDENLVAKAKVYIASIRSQKDKSGSVPEEKIADND
ncbi:SycD/LcrH family type III secretion system chaperone [Kalamiella sp. sgz302252]|uniref:SycD/LcrH family type III secretion system chaperone n=1 Tax=Pantoea sp. sgz302252 TaxID=3341827 RepID=UPI0036D37AAA